jgi:arylsulfatase A-like enzyme
LSRNPFIKMKAHLALLALLALSLALSFAAHAAVPARPNFLVIMGEAQGWASMSVPQDDRHPEGSTSDFIHTPHLDRLALQGTRFSDFYAASPRCTPTRAAFFTGRSPAQLHMTFVNEGKKDGGVSPGDKVIPPTSITELPLGIETIGTLLQHQGYATAHFGKWHCGRANPQEHGFAENDGPNNNGGPENVEDPNPKQCYAIAELGIDFITRQTKAHKPFYLHLSQYPGRGPVTALPETVEAVKNRLGTRLDFQRISTAAGNEEIDKTIGLVLAKLQALGQLENTYIIYTADHGAQGRNANGALTNGKGTVWEGGLRVPLIIAGPGIKPGTFSHLRASTVDLYPTLAELAGVQTVSQPDGLEGGSLATVLRTNDSAPIQRAREELVIHFPHYDKDELGPASVILHQNDKLIRVYETGERHIYDLHTDLTEQHDLATSRPDRVTALDQRLTDYLTLVKADLPPPNPNYIPNGERSGDRSGDRRGGGKGKGAGNKSAQPAAPNTPPTKAQARAQAKAQASSQP